MDRIEAFIARWSASGAAERANYQLFLAELCELLDLPRPDPAQPDDRQNAYVFERAVVFHHGDGTTSTGFIDLYRRGAFVLEAKQGAQAVAADRPLSEEEGNRKLKQGTARRGTRGWDDAMLRARGQAEQYARALPASEGRPPFVVVVDVGHSIELYSEFTRSGGTYVPFPDPRSHRIRLEQLRDDAIRERLRALWLEPLALDPSRRAARVTRDIAERLARLAVSLERAGHGPDSTAQFLMRCLFTMFAEDVGLLPKNAFLELLESLRDDPRHFAPQVSGLWAIMNHGGYSLQLKSNILRFNGGLFADSQALPLDRDQLQLLIEAAKADWRHVEPSIFGTLLERALEPRERHRLGAHYTPRAYVERLVLPTVVEPLRDEWQAVQAAALTLDRQGKHDAAVDEIRKFHHRLCSVRVLDPACGSGNFLYVTLEHLKRLEGEVLNSLEELGETQQLLDMAGVTVDPHQFLGLEINPRAAAIAEMVLWIGYLQWHYRTRGNVSPVEPIIHDFRNIQCRDAVLAWDAVEYVMDEGGIAVTRWDGRTVKPHPVTGEDVPDETARVPLERYLNPRKAEWPAADYVVGNPPFIGTANMRRALGDGYVEALRGTWNEVPESADFVMYWWHHAADLARDGKIKRFGLITTNSIRQTFNRRVIEHHMAQKMPLSLVFAVPDHPWVDAADGAAVRIAMTVGEGGGSDGQVALVVEEIDSNSEGVDVILSHRAGRVFADLSIGANVAGADSLQANRDLSNRGVCLFGAGFIVTPADTARLLSSPPTGEGAGVRVETPVIRHYRNGRDLMDRPRGVMVIDLYGLDADTVRDRYPAIYQWVLERVKPERDHNNRESRRKNWWIFGEPNSKLRKQLAGLPRYIATVETAKHRVFQFLDAEILPDNMLVNVAIDDAFTLGILSSRLHVAWALAAGGTLEDRPRYNKTRCFETFPFPDATPDQQTHIRDLAERIDAHRKRQQAQHPELTLTGLYNVLEKLRAGETFTAKDKAIHEQGLVSVLAQLHDELDAAVFDAYGWNDLAPMLIGKPGGTTPLPDRPEAQADAEEELLKRITALNAERAAEEARGLVRWLRPEFQNPQGAGAVTQTEAEVETEETTTAPAAKQPWPKTLPEQVQTLRTHLARHAQPQTAKDIATRFKGAQARRIEELLATLAALGQARVLDDGRYLGG